MNYNVGQILWVIRSNDMQVFPIRIVEKINTQRLTAGIETHYNVQAPTIDRIITLTELIKSCSIFESVEELREFMIKNATSSIDEMIELAKPLLEEFV